MPIEPRAGTHIDINDRAVREEWTRRFGVSDERLRKIVRMVGSRVTTVAAHLGSPVH